MKDNAVFVFGSNTAGIHGAGAAAHAYKGLGARWGQSYGHVGHTFAIPTKGHIYERHSDKPYVGITLNLPMIQGFVVGFLAYAHTHPELDFKVTRLGCGLAGLKDADIAQMFIASPSNCYFDEVWFPYLGSGKNYWGTYA